MAATVSSTSSVHLHCRHCGGKIESNTRRVQCAHCGALFPFVCMVCARNLRPPFPVFDDERYITFEATNPRTGAVTEAKPLCQEHFLRRCPDCERWFHAHENPGFFRCPACSAEKARREALEEAALAQKASALLNHVEAIVLEEPKHVRRRQLEPNIIALAVGVGALAGLICWYLLNL